MSLRDRLSSGAARFSRASDARVDLSCKRWAATGPGPEERWRSGQPARVLMVGDPISSGCEGPVMTPWARVREPRGRYCWQVTVGAGCLLSLELGAPHLEVVEGLRHGLPRREVTARGTWQLALHECAFILAAGDGEAAETADLEELRAAARELEGQALLEVVDEAPSTRFVFDLGAELRVAPLPELGGGALQWALTKVGAETVGRRGNGRLVVGV